MTSKVKFNRNYILLIVSGSVGIHEETEFDIDIVSALNLTCAPGPKRSKLVIDLESVPTMHSGPLARIKRLHEQSCDMGKEVFILKPSHSVHDLIRTCNLQKTLTIVQSIEEL